MKLLFFTSVKAVHSNKWLKSLAADFDVHVVCFAVPQHERIAGVTYHEILPKTTPDGAGASTQKGERDGSAQTRKQDAIASEAWLTFKNGIKFASRFAQVIDTVQPDVIHAHQSVPFGWYAVRAQARARHRAPLVVSVWGTDVMAYPEHHWLFRLMNYSVLKRATALTATSQALVAASKRWTKRTAWLVIFFGVEPTLFPQKKTRSRHATIFGMAKQLRFIGEQDVYGFTTALRALALARQTKPNLVLEIAGSGPQEQHLKTLAANLGIEKHVRFLGHIPQNKLGATMARWDALLLPSQQESFGVVAVEAAAVGIPVLGARVGGIPEIVEHDVTGRLIPQLTAQQLAQAMLGIDSTLLERAHRRGPELVAAKFTWQKSVDRMKQVYAALTNRGQA